MRKQSIYNILVIVEIIIGLILISTTIGVIKYGWNPDLWYWVFWIFLYYPVCAISIILWDLPKPKSDNKRVML